MFICEDGSLRIHQLNMSHEAVSFWFRSEFHPTTPLACMGHISSHRKSKKPSTPKFRVDFFENCQRMQNSEVDVSDVATKFAHFLKSTPRD